MEYSYGTRQQASRLVVVLDWIRHFGTGETYLGTVLRLVEQTVTIPFQQISGQP